MYHTIEDLCNKIDVIKEKSQSLRDRQYRATACREQIQFDIDDIQALCAEVANDTKGKQQ